MHLMFLCRLGDDLKFCNRVNATYHFFNYVLLTIQNGLISIKHFLLYEIHRMNFARKSYQMLLCRKNVYENIFFICIIL